MRLVFSGVKVIVLAAAALAGCVVLRPPRSSERPRWHLISPAAWGDTCVQGRAWIRKSGKDGVGMSIELRSRGDCAVTIANADFVLELAGGKQQRFGGGVRQVPAMKGRSLLYTWIAFPFDNNAAWNGDHDQGHVQLDLVVDGRPAPPWQIAVHQDWPEKQKP